MLAVLLDPDKITDVKKLKKFIENCESAGTDFLFIGGSLLVGNKNFSLISEVKKLTKLPVLLFPGDSMQTDSSADGILFLSLISGRNAELLIGQQVKATPALKNSSLEIISTGYLLVDCGTMTTAHYMSQSMPIPFEKNEIAAVTALTGEYLGLKLIYIDGGSGAPKTISGEMISSVKKNIGIPLICGGGIKSFTDAQKIWKAGADMVVVGTLFEKNPETIKEFRKKR